MTATNRATNGHRFVFHSSEIIATERHYIADEPGVIPHDPIAIPVCPESSTSQFGYPPVHATHPDPHYAFRSRSSSPAPLSDYLPTPPLELADPSLASTHLDSFPFPRGYTFTESPYSQHSVPPPARPPHSYIPPQYTYNLTHRPTSAASSSSVNSSSPHLTHSSFAFDCPAEQKEQLPPRKLQPGDVLFWHHLAKSGEIPGVEEDARARGKQPITVAPAGGRKFIASLTFNR